MVRVPGQVKLLEVKILSMVQCIYTLMKIDSKTSKMNIITVQGKPLITVLLQSTQNQKGT